LELEIIIAGGIFVTILSLIGYKSLNRYLTIEHQKTTSSDRANFENTILNLKKEVNELDSSRRNYKYKYNAMKKDYDIEWDDLEIPENAENDKIIPMIAEALFPKMPKSMKELLGKDGIEDAIFKFVGENPDRIGSWVEKFIPKKEAQGSSTPKLTESYL